MRYWLVKSEPDSYSISDLKRDKKTCWDGVRNYQARNFMRDDMKRGDLVLFYHSSTDPPAVVGVARVAKESYPDHTAFDPQSQYYDEKSKQTEPRWMMVDLAFDRMFDAPLTLEAIRENKKLAKMTLLQKGSRLSVQPVLAEEFAEIMSMAGVDMSMASSATKADSKKKT